MQESFGKQIMQYCLKSKLNDEQVEAYTLLELENMMQRLGKSLRDVDGMPLPDLSLLKEMGNSLIKR